MVVNDPGLNPYQPNHSRNVPSTTSDALWPLSATDRPAWSNLPMRGPSMSAPQRPATPPTMWTTPEPAKSITPEPKSRGPDVREAEAHPSADQIQWDTTG
uniref:Uncharacterized protein n=1 Tax=Oryza brachyantha TaxID=4533 RepID=J3LZH1_ORYBR